MMRNGAPARAFALLIAALACGTARAQGSMVPVGGSAPATASEVIPFGDLPQRTQELDQTLRALRSNAHPSVRGFRALQAEISDYLSAVDQLRADPEFELRPDLTATAVDSISDLWRDTAVELREWEMKVSRRTADLETILGELERARQLWLRTAAQVDQPLPAALATRVERAVQDITATERLLRERRDTVFLLQDRVSEQLLNVSELEQAADDAAEGFRRSIWITDGPRLWRVLHEDRPAAGPWEQIREASAAQNRALARFVADHRSRIMLHGLLFLAIAGGLLTIRREAARWPPDDAALTAFAKTLDRPWASAALVALLPTAWIYPRAPLVVLKVVAIIITLATLRVLPALLNARLKFALFSLALLFFVGNVADILAADAPLRRFLLLALQVSGLAALALTLGVARRKARASARHGEWWKTVAAGALAGAAILVGALAANVAGKVSLTSLWTLAVVRSALLAVAGAAMGLVLGGFWAAVLRSRAAQSLHAVRRHGDLLRSRGIWVVKLAIPALWAAATLYMYRLLFPALDALRAALSATLKIREFEVSAGAILAFVLVLGAAAALSRTARFFLDEDVFPRTHLDRGV